MQKCRRTASQDEEYIKMQPANRKIETSLYLTRKKYTTTIEKYYKNITKKSDQKFIIPLQKETHHHYLKVIQKQYKIRSLEL